MAHISLHPHLKHVTPLLQSTDPQAMTHTPPWAPPSGHLALSVVGVPEGSNHLCSPQPQHLPCIAMTVFLPVRSELHKHDVLIHLFGLSA